MSEADQEPAGTRASRLLVRTLVVAGAVAGLSAAWLAGNEASADVIGAIEEQSIVADDAPVELSLHELDPSALVGPKGPASPALDPLVQPVIGVVHDAGTVLEPVEQVGEQPGTRGGQHAAAEPDIESPSWTQPAKAPEAPSFTGIAPRAEAPVTTVPPTIEPSARTPNSGDNPDPLVEHRHSESPQPPVPTAPTGICGTDGGQGHAPGVGICWQDSSARPGIPPSSVLDLFEAHPLTGRADPQPGVTPD